MLRDILIQISGPERCFLTKANISQKITGIMGKLCQQSALKARKEKVQEISKPLSFDL